VARTLLTANDSAWLFAETRRTPMKVGMLATSGVPEGEIAMDVNTALLMAPFLSQALLGVGGHGPQDANVVVSHVPGPAEAHYLDGSRMEELFPVSLLFNGQALNITAVSYDGQFNIGCTGCRDSVPSLQRIAVFSGEELQRLESALGIGGDSPAPTG